MIKKPACALNILTIYMHISNACVCNKYLLNEYECIYTNIHEATWIHEFNLINICCILTEYKLGLKRDGNTQDSFLFPGSYVRGGEPRPPVFWRWFSKWGLWPSSIDTTWRLVRSAVFTACHWPPNQNSVGGGSEIFVCKSPPGESDTH